MVFGSMPNDGGYLSDFSDEDYRDIAGRYPEAKTLFRPFVGAKEYLNNKKRWCLWLVDADPYLIKNIPPVREAVQSVREMRESSNREATRKLADYPALFGEIRQPDSDYLIVPRHTSENRRYIPIGYMTREYICGDSNLLIPNASLYEFGVLISNVHMAWMRAICGRLEMRYRYSGSLVYNNFPWPNPTPEQKQAVINTARAILDVRQKYSDKDLTILYDPDSMPKELTMAHAANNKAVMRAYGFSVKDMSENDCVAKLIKMYQSLVG
jgi:hypothetical protein